MSKNIVGLQKLRKEKERNLLLRLLVILWVSLPYLSHWLSSNLAFSQTTSGASFLKISPSVKSNALGNTSTLSALGAEALGANPANIGFMSQRFEVFASYLTLMEDTQNQHLALAFSLPSPRITTSLFSIPLPLDSIGISITHIQTENIPLVDEWANKTNQSFNSGNKAFSLGASKVFSSYLRLGMSAKVIDSYIAGYTSNIALVLDVGATLRLRPLYLGFSLNNLGEGVGFIHQKDPPPTSLSLGISLPLGAIIGVFEIHHRIYENKAHMGMGIEYNFKPIAFRAGYLIHNDLNQSPSSLLQDPLKTHGLLGGLSGGVGIVLGTLRLDYAISKQHFEFNPSHKISVTFKWGDGKER